MLLRLIARGLNHLAEEFVSLSAQSKGADWTLEAHMRLVALESLSSKIKKLVVVSLQLGLLVTFLKAALTPPAKDARNDGPEEAT